MDKPTFLVVDDDPIALEVARERLSRIGFHVTTRGESLGTSAWIRANKPDFVLLDVMMPALTGSELAVLLKRRHAETAIILYSSKPRSELDRFVRESGALGAISKGATDTFFKQEVLRLTRSARIDIQETKDT